MFIESKHQKEQRIIKSIHDDFDTAQERLLAQSKELLESIGSIDATDAEQKADRLARLGFVNTSNVKQAEVIKKERQEKEAILVKTKEEAQTIEYYKRTYPFLKFLTESELDKICTKYGLVYAPVKNYIEFVPDKNLAEIENAQSLMKVDLPQSEYMLKISSFWGDCPSEIKQIFKDAVKWTHGDIISDGLCRDYARSKGYNGNYNHYVYHLKGGEITKLSKEGLFICAPPSHFNTKDLKKNGLGFFEFTTIEIQDPIVFRYVRGGIQVITKWGLEASDEALINPINN